MSICYIGNKLKILCGNIKIKKGLYAGNVFYSAGNIVTYRVDSNITYQEEVDSGASCLSPSSFTPAKSGWIFAGWRTDASANGTVLTGKVMGDDPITLYAVFRQTVTLTCYNGGSAASNTAGTRYYNNGNVSNPSFTVTPAALSGWIFNGWCAASSPTAAVSYSSISGTAFDANTTLYAKYSQTVTLSYNGNGSSGGSTAAQTGTRYFNSGQYSNPTFTLRANGFTRTGYTWTKWAMGSGGGTQYAGGATVTLSANTVFYALWVAAPHYFTPLNSVTWTKIREIGKDTSFTVSASEVRLRARKNPDAIAYGGISVQTSIPTGGCSKVRFTVSVPYNGNLRAEDPTIFVDDERKDGSGNLEFSISGKSTITVIFGMSAAASYAPVDAVLSQIYFYN
ncbi:MAG: InlB B-repeat-containing protein [Acetatifactor sp.]|nr:InlB B-repeat-containing protein [Acetatifactor sp.]